MRYIVDPIRDKGNFLALIGGGPSPVARAVPEGLQLSSGEMEGLLRDRDEVGIPGEILEFLFLHRSVEWKLSAFFRCIGQKKPGEKLVMDWGNVIGSKGRAHFKPRSYKANNGEDREANELDRFIDYDERFFDGQDDLPF